MKVYMAAMCNNGMYAGQRPYRTRLNDFEQQVTDTYTPDRLESYHYVANDKHTRTMAESGHTVLLDSGAYSAATLGTTVDLDAYVKYIKRNEGLVRRDSSGALLAAGLDSIGNAEETWDNQRAMEDALGEPPIPCYHFGDPEELAEVCASGYKYIALGGMVGGSTPRLERWLDRIWGRYLVDSDGNPRTRVHGFGLTSLRLMERYPWASVDSSSWVQTSSFGGILIPEIGVVQMSHESPSRKVAGQHYTSMTPLERERVEHAVTRRGYCMDRMQRYFMTRRVFNLQAYWEMREAVSGGSFKPERQELF
jgi:hypothetical protein